LLIPGASEKVVYRKYISVPRFDTDALAEKAKIWKFNVVKGIRQHWPFSLGRRGVYLCVFRNGNALVDFNNKDGPTVYQKRSRLLIWKDLYNRWSLPSGGASKRVSTRLRPIKRRV